MFSNSKQEKTTVEEISNSSNHIGKGTYIDGNIETHGNLRIEGRVKGNVKSKSKVVLGKSSNVEGNILAQNAEIAGEVNGTLEISEMLILKPSAVINGDIITNKLLVESGSIFNGTCKMGVPTKDIVIGSEPNGKPERSPVKEITPEPKKDTETIKPSSEGIGSSKGLS
jgi:cytoskeletal protein CcmA (bactofilin family)